jgi:hypothetical protein
VAAVVEQQEREVRAWVRIALKVKDGVTVG